MENREPETIVHPVVIIGAGLFGLAAAHELQRCGLSAPVLDADREIAASWRRRHPQLRLNTHRWLSALPGLRMPRAAGPFPARDDVVRYLERYEWLIERPIEYETRVRRIDPEHGHWRLDTSRGPVRAQHVIVATGRERVPYIPDWPGRETYTGMIRSAAELGAVDEYAGKRVLVVGAGTSGSDALNHLAGVATAELWVSVRHGPAVLPTRLAGVPIQLLSPLMAPLPPRLLDVSFRLTERLVFGDLRRHDLGSHVDGAATRLARDGVGPAFDLGFVAALKSGKIRPVAAVSGFDRERVRLVDGRSLDPDVVICATGYRPGLEPLVGHLDVLDGNGVPRTLDATGRSPLPGLRFAGMTPKLTGQFLTARSEARAIARALGRAGSGPRTASAPSLPAAA